MCLVPAEMTRLYNCKHRNAALGHCCRWLACFCYGHFVPRLSRREKEAARQAADKERAAQRAAQHAAVAATQASQLAAAAAANAVVGGSAACPRPALATLVCLLSVVCLCCIRTLPHRPHKEQFASACKATPLLRAYFLPSSPSWCRRG